MADLSADLGLDAWILAHGHIADAPAIRSCNCRQIIVFAIGRRDLPVALDHLKLAFTLYGCIRRQRCSDKNGNKTKTGPQYDKSL